MSNKKVVALTRPISRSKEAIKLIEDYGGEALVVPTLELELLNSPSLKDFMSEIDDLDWLIFTSVSSLDSIFKFYPDFNDKLSNKCKTAVIGHKTAEVTEKYGIAYGSDIMQLEHDKIILVYLGAAGCKEIGYYWIYKYLGEGK